MIKDELWSDGGARRREYAARELARKIRRSGEEAELRIRARDLLPRRDRRHDRKPGERPAGHPCVLELPTLDENSGGDAECDGCKHLIRDAEQRPQDVDATIGSITPT